MVKMKLSGMFTLVLGLAAALSQGCGSDSNGNSDGTGSGGSGNANGMTSCDYTKCTGDPSYGLFSQEACDALMKAPCAAEYAAKNKCSLAPTSSAWTQPSGRHQ